VFKMHHPRRVKKPESCHCNAKCSSHLRTTLWAAVVTACWLVHYLKALYVLGRLFSFDICKKCFYFVILV
jgi:hypothetical protein